MHCFKLPVTAFKDEPVTNAGLGRNNIAGAELDDQACHYGSSWNLFLSNKHYLNEAWDTFITLRRSNVYSSALAVYVVGNNQYTVIKRRPFKEDYLFWPENLCFHKEP